ncbi:thioredoxin family protein [Ideonella sp. B7]|nr:thioredoxin family protein [Ideonella benzenivorans]
MECVVPNRPLNPSRLLVPSRPRWRGLLAAGLLGAALVTPDWAAPSPAATGGVAWLDAAAQADIDRAFAQGQAQHKPVLVYWGASWCPPCNQLKATLFNRQDFIERSRSVVAVHIDGDAPGAQKLGAHFKVRGYPTLILFSPKGQEITRLPGEAEAAQVMNLLQMGLAGGRPIQAVLAEARAGKALSANDWRMLAFYSWDTDEAQLVPAPRRGALLGQLAAACPPAAADAATRLLLKALAETAPGQPVPGGTATAPRVRQLLADPAASRAQMDVLVNAAPDIVRALAPQAGPARTALVQATDAALTRLQADATLSRSDRLSALMARVDLARLDQPQDTVHPQLPKALTQEVRALAARMDREITDGYERQAVITGAAHALGQAGLWQDSNALLQANLAKSHAPYYLMSQLGSNARRLGDSAGALRWYGQAWARSQGPATRLQWGANYVGALVELAPQDEATIEKVAGQVFAEAGAQNGAFYERSARALQKVGGQLVTWNAQGRHAAALGRLRAQLSPVCARQPAADGQKATCDGLLKG